MTDSPNEPTAPDRDLDVGRALLLSASAVIVIAGLRASGPVLIPFLFAFFLALLGFPMVQWLRDRGVRLSLSIAVTVLLEFSVLTLLGYLMSTTFSRFARAAPGYLNALTEKVKGLITALEARGLDLSDWISVESLDPAAVMDLAGNILGGTVKGLASFVSYFLLVLVILICAMFEVAGFPQKLRRIQGDPSLLDNFKTVMSDTQKYLGVKTLISITTGVLVGVWVWLFDMPIPLFWAVSAFLLNYIPAVGSILAAIPAVLVALVQQGLGTALFVGAGYLVVNFLLGNLIEPLLMGRRFRLSTLVVFLALIFWGWIWGPIGMILSIPLTMILKIGLQRSEELRWIALLMEPAGDAAPPVAAEPRA